MVSRVVRPDVIRPNRLGYTTSHFPGYTPLDACANVTRPNRPPCGADFSNLCFLSGKMGSSYPRVGWGFCIPLGPPSKEGLACVPKCGLLDEPPLPPYCTTGPFLCAHASMSQTPMANLDILRLANNACGTAAHGARVEHPGLQGAFGCINSRPNSANRPRRTRPRGRCGAQVARNPAPHHDPMHNVRADPDFVPEAPRRPMATVSKPLFAPELPSPPRSREASATRRASSHSVACPRREPGPTEA